METAATTIEVTPTLDVIQLFYNLRSSVLALDTTDFTGISSKQNCRDDDLPHSKPSPTVQKRELEMVESILKKNEEEKQMIQNHVCFYLKSLSSF